MAKILVGKDIGSYAFDASLQTITFSGMGTVNLEDILVITNVTDNVIIYNFANSTKGGTISSNVLTLTYDTTSMSDSDDLQIFVEIEDTATDYSQGYKNTSIVADRKTTKYSSEPLVSTENICTTTDTFEQKGSKIDLSTVSYLGIFGIYTKNSDSAATLQLIASDEFSDTDEYTPIDTDFTVTLPNTLATEKFFKMFDVRAIDSCEIHTQSTFAATVGTIALNILKQE